MASTLQWLFNEAFGGVCGREAMMDRLFEVLVIQFDQHFGEAQGEAFKVSYTELLLQFP
jgi:hypothetical protein